MELALDKLELKDVLAIGISTLAFVSAGIANVLSLSSKAATDRTQARGSFNEICVKIAELSATLQVLRAEQRDASNLLLYNTKVDALVQRIVALATLGREVLSRSGIEAATPEYALLADGVALSGDPAAEDLWRKAVAAARTNHDRADINQRYAGYLYTTGDSARGAAAYAQAEAAMNPATPFMVGRNRQLEGMALANGGDATGARARLAEAQTFYESMPGGAQRSYALNSLAEAFKAAFGEPAL